MTGRAVQGSCYGFTMAEVLVSMWWPRSPSRSYAHAAHRRTHEVLARDGTTAIGLAQASWRSCSLRPTVRTDGDDTLAPLATSTAFTRTWRVEPSLTGEVHRLSATVEWDDGAHQITLETFAWEP